jgi:hypothetical protein
MSVPTLPENEEGLEKSDGDQLRGYVENYYERNLPKTQIQKEET